MPQLIWDKIDERVYQTGLDRGVLYLPDGSAVPWNGLTEVNEKNSAKSRSVYYDGRKINQIVSLGEFQASLKAITYPDEFVELEGLGSIRHGAWLGEQKPQMFALAYRTRVGNALDGDVGYKIHIVYNVYAVASDTSFASVTQDPSMVEFEWDLQTIPDDIDGYRPTSHMVIDSRELDPWLLEEIEEILYGAEFAAASLIPMPELVAKIKDWCRYRVTDNEDGTYTVTYAHPSGVVFSGTDDEVFQLLGIHAIYEDDDGTFKIEDTCDISDVPQIKIIDNGDGSWTAETEFETLFVETPEGEFRIFNANAVMIAVDAYSLSDTTE